MSTNALQESAVARRRQRDIGLLAGVIIVLVVLGTLGFATRQVGSIDVSVREFDDIDGTNIAFSVPAAMVETAIQLVPAEAYRSMSREAEEVLPFLIAAGAQLEDLPDCVLVDVRSDGEHVRIAKRQNRFLIDVETRDEEVRVALPLDTISAAVAKLARISRDYS